MKYKPLDEEWQQFSFDLKEKKKDYPDSQLWIHERGQGQIEKVICKNKKF